MPQPASATELDLVKTVLPVVTFLLGIVVSQLDKWRDLRRKVRNVRTMLRQELVEDYRLLNPIVPRAGQGVGNPHIVALMAGSTSTSIYDAYLSKLDDLSAKDLDAVYNAYLSIKTVRKSGDEFLKALEDKTQERGKFAALATSLVVAAESALGKTKDALARLAADACILSVHECDRGTAFDRFSQIEKLLAERKDDS